MGSSDIDSLEVKNLGDFSAGMSDKLRSIQKKENTAYTTFSEISGELENLVFSTGVDPGKFLEILKKDSRYGGEIGELEGKTSRLSWKDIDPSVVDSIVDSALTLELMRKLVLEAGGERKLREFLQRRYGIRGEDISISHAAVKLETKRIETLEEFRKYFDEGLTDLGLSGDEVFYPLTVMSTGVVLAAKISGRVVGLLDLMFDRDGGCFVHNVSVSKREYGLGIPGRLLKDVEKYCDGRRMWSAVNRVNLGLLLTFMENGYRISGLARDFYGEGVDAFIVEKKSGDAALDYKMSPETKVVEDPNGVEEPCAIRIHAALSDPYRIFSSHDAVALVKSKEHGDLLILTAKETRPQETRINLLPGEDTEPYRFETLETPEDMEKAQELDEKAYGLKRESVHTLMLMSKVGIFLGVKLKDTEELVGLTPIVFDGSNGAYIFSVAVLPTQPREKLRALILEELEKIMKAYGRNRAWLTVNPTDVLSTALLFNLLGFTGRNLILNYFGEGENRFIAEKTVGETRSRFNYGPNTKYLKNYFDYDASSKSYLVDIKNFGLMKTLIQEGFDVVQVVAGDLNKRNVGVEKELYLLNKD